MPKGTPRVLPIKICKKCQKEYQTTSSRQSFCEDCRSTAWYVWSLEYKKRLRRLCQMAKNRAKAKGLAYDITPEYLISLWELHDGKCELTGQKLDLSKWGGHAQVNPRAPSVDRINPKKGYTKGNVRLITYHMNISLSDFGTEEFETLIECYGSQK